MPVIVKNQNRYRKVYPATRKSGQARVSYTTQVESGEITMVSAFEPLNLQKYHRLLRAQIKTLMSL